MSESSYDDTYVPQPSQQNSDMFSSFIGSDTSGSGSGSESGSVKTTPEKTAELVSEGEHVVYKHVGRELFCLKTPYILPKRYDKPLADYSEVHMVTQISSMPETKQYNLAWIKKLRDYIKYTITDIGMSIREWYTEKVLKLHDSWKKVSWSHETAKKFPKKFKSLVQIFLLDKNYTEKRFKALSCVFRHIADKEVAVFEVEK